MPLRRLTPVTTATRPRSGRGSRESSTSCVSFTSRNIVHRAERRQGVSARPANGWPGHCRAGYARPTFSAAAQQESWEWEMAVLRVATCQFPVSADVARNAEHVARQLRIAKDEHAEVAHFPEGALSGYAGVAFGDFSGYDWETLRGATQQILQLARERRTWAVPGAAERLRRRNKPPNSV